MPNEPISGLTQIGRTALPGGSFSPTSGDMIEILDVTDTSMASTGTNKRIAPSDLISQFAPAPLTSSYVTQATESLSYNVTTGFANVGLSLTLPSAGLYFIVGIARGTLQMYGTQGQDAYMVSQLYDSTASVVIANSQVMLMLNTLQSTTGSTNPFSFQQSGPVGPVIYNAPGANVIQVQALYGGNASLVSAGSALVSGDNNGASSLTAVRIA